LLEIYQKKKLLLDLDTDSLIDNPGQNLVELEDKPNNISQYRKKNEWRNYVKKDNKYENQEIQDHIERKNK